MGNTMPHIASQNRKPPGDADFKTKRNKMPPKHAHSTTAKSHFFQVPKEHILILLLSITQWTELAFCEIL